ARSDCTYRRLVRMMDKKTDRLIHGCFREEGNDLRRGWKVGSARTAIALGLAGSSLLGSRWPPSRVGPAGARVPGHDSAGSAGTPSGPAGGGERSLASMASSSAFCCSGVLGTGLGARALVARAAALALASAASLAKRPRASAASAGVGSGLTVAAATAAAAAA